MQLPSITTIIGIIFLPALLLISQSCHGYPDEYKVPMAKLENFIGAVVKPLAETIKIKGIGAKEGAIRKKFCNIVSRLQRDYDYMVETLKKGKDNEGGCISVTFRDIKDRIATYDYVAKKNELPEMFQGKISKAFGSGIDRFCRISKLKLKQTFQKNVEELKLLQSQNDFSSERARELAYACIYMGRAMAKVFIGIDGRIGELHWALQQFPVDLLAYKMEIPELRDIHIEWDQQDGISRGLVLAPIVMLSDEIESFERAKLLMDNFNDTLLKPLREKCIEMVEARSPELKQLDSTSNWQTPLMLLCMMANNLGKYKIDELDNDLRVLEEKESEKKEKQKEAENNDNNNKGMFIVRGILGLIGFNSEKRKQEVNSDVEQQGKGKTVLTEPAENGNNNSEIAKTKRIVLLRNGFQAIKTAIGNSTKILLDNSQKNFGIPDEFYSRVRYSNGKGRKELAGHFKVMLKKLEQQIRANGDFTSMEVKQTAFDCVGTVNRLLTEFIENPAYQLIWSLQQFTLNLMLYSMEVPWAREFPVLRIISLIEHTKAVQLLKRFNRQILVKLGAKCREIGNKKEAKSSLEQNMCRSVFEMLKAVDQVQTALKEPNTDGGNEVIGKILSDIKRQIYLHDVSGLWKHLEAQIPKESKQIKEEVDKLFLNDELTKINNDDGANPVDIIDQRFEQNLSKLRDLQTKNADFSSVEVKLLAFDCVYTSHCMVFFGNPQHENPVDKLAAAIRQFAVDLLVYRMEIGEIRDIPEILKWTYGME